MIKFVNVYKQIVNGTNWTVRMQVGNSNKFYWADLFEDLTELSPRTLRIHVKKAYTYEFDGGRFRQQIIDPKTPQPEFRLSVEPTISGGWKHMAIDSDDKTVFDSLRPQFKQF